MSFIRIATAYCAFALLILSLPVVSPTIARAGNAEMERCATYCSAPHADSCFRKCVDQYDTRGKKSASCPGSCNVNTPPMAECDGEYYECDKNKYPEVCSSELSDCKKANFRLFYTCCFGASF